MVFHGFFAPYVKYILDCEVSNFVVALCILGC